MTKRYKTVAKKYLMVFATAVALLSSCKVNDDEFFELRDRGGIDAAIWDTQGSVQMHLNRAYDVIMPQFLFQDHNTNNMNGRYGVHFASDESFFPVADQWARAALGLQGELGNNDIRFAGNVYTSNAGGNKYMDISRCNDAITNIPKGTMSPEHKRSFLGQYYALRAMVYFELVKVYGGVPLVLTPQSPDNLTVSGRASARECFQAITNDLDSAINNLNNVVWANDATDRGKISKLAATCLKAKVLLYWASPQFNPGNDASRWSAALEANKTAYDLAVSSGRVLLPNYANIFQTEGDANTEVIMVRTYSNTVERRGHDGERRSRPSSEGGSPHQGYRATTRLLDAYPMLDGNPIGSPGQYTYDDLMFWQNRDPRFSATIAYNGGVWALSGKPTRKQWTYTGAISEASLMPVYCKRFTTPSIASGAVPYTNNLGGNGMDWIEMRFAEVILNYAECANEMGNLTLAKDMVRKIRVRAGIIAGTGGNDYGLGSVTGAPRMRDLILNERMIEFAFENKRNSDLRRTRRMHLLTGNMTSIEIEVIGGTTVRNALEVIVNPTTGDRFRETLNMESRAVYSQYFRKNVVGVQGYLPYNIPEFHYFYTFHNDFVNTGANIQATIGWAGGTFDPLAN